MSLKSNTLISIIIILMELVLGFIITVERRECVYVWFWHERHIYMK